MKLLKNKYIRKFLPLLLPVLFLPASCVREDLPAGGGEEIILPLSLSFGMAATRGGDDLVNGSDVEHAIDFDVDKECYAILFGADNRVTEIRPLLLTEQLGYGSVPEEEGSVSEYRVSSIVYVHKDRLPAKMLVVLNGGNIYEKIRKRVEELLNQHTDDDTAELMQVTWPFSEGPIGINAKGHYTMTNSAWYDENGNLMTVVPVEQGRFYTTISEYLADPKPSATVYVERMVAKFSAPALSTEVIGSDRIFRPSQTALPLVVYSWNGADLLSDQKNWRIHLLGWTINGIDRENYIFKNIPTSRTALDGWFFGDWNDSAHKRSYWSIDPHYNSTEDFYPWQYRKAADRTDIISVQAAAGDKIEPVLHYYSFADVGWSDGMVTSENTFDPTVGWNLDNRDAVLAGSHFLVTAELLLEQEEGEYIGRFDKVGNIYSDRIRRYYLSEADWFKMFVHEFNRALSTQEHMSFVAYNWEDGGVKTSRSCTTDPTGECRLYYNDELLTYEVIDRLVAGDKPLSVSAYVREGDGRVIPWIEGLSVKSPSGAPLAVKDDEENPLSWDDNMYKSLFYEWFGPVDHYFGGKMYYAGPIKHHGPGDGSATDYYGTVRNHWYKFTIASVNALGIPVDDIFQPIIPGNYDYNDQMSVYLEILGWHLKDTYIELD